MARIVLTIQSDLFDEPNQEASIRENLPIRTLLTETRKEFALPDGSYNLSIKSSGKTLEPDKTLEQQGVQSGALLLLNRERRVMMRESAASVMDEFSKHFITSLVRCFVTEDESGETFEIQWQPAIIGRPDANNAASAEMLAVNLGPFEGAKTVSRHHARITEQNGQYYVECMAEHNPTYLNDSQVRAGERRFLQGDDKIRVGKFSLTVTLKEA
jgi:hypothetical protein